MAFDLDDDELKMTRKMLYGLNDEKKEAHNGKETKRDESNSRNKLRNK